MITELFAAAFVPFYSSSRCFAEVFSQSNGLTNQSLTEAMVDLHQRGAFSPILTELRMHTDCDADASVLSTVVWGNAPSRALMWAAYTDNRSYIPYPMSNVRFDPSKFTVSKAKPLPVILLLDVSGSMLNGAKIGNLNDAVRDMLETFSGTENSETEIHVAVITFGAEVLLHQPLTSASSIRWRDLSASGGTPLGTAIAMAKAMIEDKDVVPSRAYRPTVVLVSDGRPTDSWETPLHGFIREGRSAKCDRMSMAIGADADETVLGEFIKDTKNPLFYAENARQLKDCFKFITMSVAIRTKSQTPNVVPEVSAISETPPTIEARQAAPKSEPQKPSSVTGKSEPSEEEEGYW